MFVLKSKISPGIFDFLFAFPCDNSIKLLNPDVHLNLASCCAKATDDK